MKVLTWNIFFDKINIVERTRKIIEIAVNTKSDIILFQEVRFMVLDMVLNLMQSAGYFLPSQEIQTKRVKYFGYSTLSFVKSNTNSVDVKIIPYALTYMDRDIMEIKTQNVTLYNVHLESMNTLQFKTIRSQQLNSLLCLMENKPAIACGDFNIVSDIYHDEISNAKSGNTYFSSRFNKNSSYEAPYDKIIYNKNFCSCDFLGHVGTDTYTFGYCSDHNGLLFNINNI